MTIFTNQYKKRDIQLRCIQKFKRKKEKRKERKKEKDANGI